MSVDRGSGITRALASGGPGSEAITHSSLNQDQSSLIGTNSPGSAAESAIADINNARQILSMLYEQLGGAVPTLTKGSAWNGDFRESLVAAGRRLASAVDLLTPAPRRPCSNCATLCLVDRADGSLHCFFCGQLERGDNVVAPGEKPFDASSLAESQADGYGTEGSEL